ncbi:DUF3224 domain-containing protein [Allorhizocola rhizosphaerae]|uniref:DUF3224 domain-containing protein n=1 Tax=Allorhizocola rhizosphaerae TaxID=1872709 RepID=UPI000E3BF6BD|nr:DUF3224 domain-containing protein [Allorhizocola rhizosphaerae]
MSDTEFTNPFKITLWDETPYHEQDGGPKLTRVTVHKTFTGRVAGTSVAELLTSQSDEGSGYVASELFTGSIDGREGTLVFQHGGIVDEHDSPTSFGAIVPGSGTGELSGVTGKVIFRHELVTLTMTTRR